MHLFTLKQPSPSASSGTPDGGGSEVYGRLMKRVLWSTFAGDGDFHRGSRDVSSSIVGTLRLSDTHTAWKHRRGALLNLVIHVTALMGHTQR